MYTRPEQLASDIAQVLSRGDYSRFFQWYYWDLADTDGREARFFYPKRYPLTFFTVRLMELVAEPVSTLDLRGTAKRVLGWFVSNSERLESNVRADTTVSRKQRRESSADVLRESVRRDEIAEDW